MNARKYQDNLHKYCILCSGSIQCFLPQAGPDLHLVKQSLIFSLLWMTIGRYYTTFYSIHPLITTELGPIIVLTSLNIIIFKTFSQIKRRLTEDTVQLARIEKNMFSDFHFTAEAAAVVTGSSTWRELSSTLWPSLLSVTFHGEH